VIAFRCAVVFLIAHVRALGLGMFGLLSVVPNVAQFANNPYALAFYNWALVNTGTVDILTGALAMLAFGFARVGVSRTLVFLLAATLLSAAAVLTGTKTGWPFGGYQYLGFLGFKLGGRVPYTVPLSWFYMGFASFFLARAIVGDAGRRTRSVFAVVLGAWLLMAWDLVLDPAMASDKMTIMHFWMWKEHGAYFGMPLRNLAGWFGTGLAFMAVAQTVWNALPARRFSPGRRTVSAWFPFALYAVNVIWAMTLSVSVGLWLTALAAIALSLAPAALALRPPARGIVLPA